MFLMTKAMLPKMIANGGGMILNMASVLGRRESGAQPPCLRRKQGGGGRLHARARDRSREAEHPRELRLPGHGGHASLGERINAFADPVQARKDFVARQPMGRLATAEEIAETFVYLVSDESSFMTGQAVFVDGGMSL